jgi:hypothetical protein
VQNTLVQATIFKKCDRTYQRPGTNKGCVAGTCHCDDTVRMLAEGITAAGRDKNGRTRTRVMPGVGIAPWLQRDDATVLRPRQRQRRTAHQRDDERPLDHQARPGQQPRLASAVPWYRAVPPGNDPDTP